MANLTRCDECQALMINGVFCHETGCPNSKKIWDEESQEWILYVDCFICGFPVREGETCDCLDPVEPEDDNDDNDGEEE